MSLVFFEVCLIAALPESYPINRSIARDSERWNKAPAKNLFFRCSKISAPCRAGIVALSGDHAELGAVQEHDIQLVAAGSIRLEDHVPAIRRP